MEGQDASLWAGPPCGESLVGGVARRWDSGPGCFWALGGASSLQSAVRSVGKVESGSQFSCPRHSGPHPASWPSSRPTLSKMTVFLNTTTSSARTFSSELKQGTRERSGVGELGSEWNCCWMRQHRGQVLSTLLLGDHRPQVSWGSGRMG